MSQMPIASHGSNAAWRGLRRNRDGVAGNVVGVKLSRAGSIISLVCAVHCALTPVAVLALPLLAAQYGGVLAGSFGAVFSHATDWVFLGVIVVIAGFGVLATYPVHGDRRPAVLTVAGFVILLLVRVFLEPASTGEIAGDLLGASSIAWGGWMNRALCRCHGCHEQPLRYDNGEENGDQPVPSPAAGV